MIVSIVRRWATTAVIGLAAAGLCLATAPSRAASPPSTEADLERAFQAVLADLTDLDAAFEYARIAAELGDYEAAISSMERILMFEPDLLQVQIELGVMYFRLGSYEAAQGYFDQALANDNLPPPVRTRIETFTAQAERQTSNHRFSAYFSGGLRYQTNANLAPGGTILSFGTPTALPSQFASKDDFNVFASIHARHLYDFGGAQGDHLETNIGLFASRQFQEDDFNVTYLNADIGPRLVVPATGGVSLRPYATLSALFIAGDYYQTTAGGGAELLLPITPSWSLSLDGSIKYAAYENSADRPTATDLDGQEARFNADLTYLFDKGGITLSGDIATISARESFESYRELSASLFVWKSVSAPVDISGTGLPWIISLDAVALTRDYSAANPAVSPKVRREDELRFDAKLVIPVSPLASVFMGAGWQDVQSNLPNYTFDNITVLGGFSARF